MVIYCRNNKPHKVPPIELEDEGYIDLEAVAHQIEMEREIDEQLEEIHEEYGF